MANTTVYPYGTEGSLPASIGIINDLTTGGADKALSAQMGKKLDEDGIYAEAILAAKNTIFPTDATSWFGTSFGKGVNILHFSDLHGDAVNLARIVAFKAKISDLAALHTGDAVNNTYADGIDFWSAAGASGIMNCIGNHDCYYNKTAAECYARYISPFVSGWGVTSQSNVCYYYKDWAAKYIRLIVLDCIHWDATQKSWLESTLASAKTAGYHVVVASHYAPGASTGIKGTSFDTLGANSASWNNINSQAPAAVQAFIDGGGHFVCWLCGHTHADMFRFPTSYPAQLYVAVANAGINAHVVSHAECQIVRENGEHSQDLFNIVSINATRQTLTIVRVGADRDTIGRHIGTIVYDYANKEILQ